MHLLAAIFKPLKDLTKIKYLQITEVQISSATDLVFENSFGNLLSSTSYFDLITDYRNVASINWYNNYSSHYGI